MICFWLKGDTESVGEVGIDIFCVAMLFVRDKTDISLVFLYIV